MGRRAASAGAERARDGSAAAGRGCRGLAGPRWSAAASSVAGGAMEGGIVGRLNAVNEECWRIIGERNSARGATAATGVGGELPRVPLAGSWLDLIRALSHCAGSLQSSMSMPAESLQAHEAAIRNNPHSTPSLKACADIHRKEETREGYMRAIEFLQRTLNVEPNDGDSWGSLGYCYLMVDDVQKAFTAYQQALYLIPSPQDPYLWYGLGILYERYNSYDQADEYFKSGG